MTSFQERFCPAKINLFLEVLGKREDGTHEIATIMVPLDDAVKRPAFWTLLCVALAVNVSVTVKVLWPLVCA